MNKVKTAHLVRLTCFVLFAVAAVAVLYLLGWLLSLWAAHHFISFIWTVGIVGGIGAIVGICYAWGWQDKVLQNAAHQEKLDEYANKYDGATPPVDRYLGVYLFNSPPRDWKGKY